MMSFWTFSDVFEEGGPIPTPFEGHFGLRAEYGINKPSFYDFALLHQLGSERLANDSQNVIVTRDKNGALIVAVWNIVDPGTQGAAKNVTLEFQGVKPDARVSVQRVDADHGNPMKAYIAMGKPQYPTPKQVAELNAASALGQPEVKQLQHGELDLDLGVNALVLIKVEK
jgi:xylan 1,4-beta-xylosidase